MEVRLDEAALRRASAAREPRRAAITPEHAFQANLQIAGKLYQAADILSARGAASFRIAAYRRAAAVVLALDADLATVATKGGREALEAIPGIGVTIAGAIAEMLTTGRWVFWII